MCATPTSFRRQNRRPRLDRALYGPGGYPVHLTLDTACGQPFSHSAALADLTLRTLEACAAERQVHLHSYCLMPDHLHFVAHVAEGGMDLITFVQYSKSQLKRGAGDLCPPNLWHRSFHDRVLWTQRELLDACDYVVQNPVRAGLVRTWREYPHVYLASYSE